MKKSLFLRIIIDIIIFYSAYIGAWWLFFPLGIISVWYYKNFFEFSLAALAFDVIYSTPREKFYNFVYIYSLIAIILSVVVAFLKSKVRKDIWPRNF